MLLPSPKAATHTHTHTHTHSCTHAAAPYAHPQALTDTQVLIPSASQEERAGFTFNLAEAEEKMQEWA